MKSCILSGTCTPVSKGQGCSLRLTPVYIQQGLYIVGVTSLVVTGDRQVV
uniref:Uncharacterized protein n=1 Tax=Octopus bimaculoides TaxID=37653 RepID=A0A0L8FT18_OCTBM